MKTNWAGLLFAVVAAFGSSGCGITGGNTSHCDARSGALDTQNQCIDLEGSDALTSGSFKVVCDGVSGKVSDGLCDHSTALGGCRTKEGAGTRTNWYYANKDNKTAADAMAKCKSGETFVASGSDAGVSTDDGGAKACDQAMHDSCVNAVPCYAAIFAACIPSGACTSGMQMQVGSFFEAPFCFASGVKFKTRTNLGNPLLGYIEYYKSTGELCWKAETTSTTSGDNTLVYSDKAGNMLATQRTTMNGSKVTVQCTGMAEVALPDGCGACMTATNSQCTAGTCTVP